MYPRNVLASSASSNNRPTIVPDRPEKHIRPTRNDVDDLYIDLVIARLTEAGDASVLRHKGQNTSAADLLAPLVAVARVFNAATTNVRCSSTVGRAWKRPPTRVSVASPCPVQSCSATSCYVSRVAKGYLQGSAWKTRRPRSQIIPCGKECAVAKNCSYDERGFWDGCERG
ncbi:MAG: hypothetical protein JWO80_4342 [Bryobacterales bacterium]|nr:hypothetical protein [Bryobacterales bacterium]